MQEKTEDTRSTLPKVTAENIREHFYNIMANIIVDRWNEGALTEADFKENHPFIYTSSSALTLLDIILRSYGVDGIKLQTGFVNRSNCPKDEEHGEDFLGYIDNILLLKETVQGYYETPIIPETELNVIKYLCLTQEPDIIDPTVNKRLINCASKLKEVSEKFLDSAVFQNAIREIPQMFLPIKSPNTLDNETGNPTEDPRIEELIKTEEAYVKRLEIFQAHLLSLEIENTNDDLSKLIDTIANMINLSTKLIENANQSKMRGTNLLALRCERVTLLKDFYKILGDHNNWMATCYRDKKNGGELERLQASLNTREIKTGENNTVDSYLMQPVQRGCRYSLLVAAIVKAHRELEIDSPDRLPEESIAILENLVEMIKEQLKQVNTSMQLMPVPTPAGHSPRATSSSPMKPKGSNLASDSLLWLIKYRNVLSELTGFNEPEKPAAGPKIRKNVAVDENRNEQTRRGQTTSTTTTTTSPAQLFARKAPMQKASSTTTNIQNRSQAEPKASGNVAVNRNEQTRRSQTTSTTTSPSRLFASSIALAPKANSSTTTDIQKSSQTSDSPAGP